MKNLVLVFGLLLGVVANAQRTEAPSAADNAGRSTASSSRSVMPTPAGVLTTVVKRTLKGGTIDEDQPINNKYLKNKARQQAQQRAGKAKAARASKSVGRSTLPKLSKPVSKPVIRPGCTRC